MNSIPIEIQFIILGTIGGIASFTKLNMHKKTFEVFFGIIFLSGSTGLVIYFLSDFIFAYLPNETIKNNINFVKGFCIISGFFHDNLWNFLKSKYTKWFKIDGEQQDKI